MLPFGFGLWDEVSDRGFGVGQASHYVVESHNVVVDAKDGLLSHVVATDVQPAI